MSDLIIVNGLRVDALSVTPFDAATGLAVRCVVSGDQLQEWSPVLEVCAQHEVQFFDRVGRRYIRRLRLTEVFRLNAGGTELVWTP